MLKILKRGYIAFGLKIKFLTFIISGIIVMGFLFCGYSIYQAHHILTHEIEKRADTIAENLAYNSKYGVITENQDILNQLLVGIIAQAEGWEGEDVTSAVIYNATGKILAERHEVIKTITTFKYHKIKNFDFSFGRYISYSRFKIIPTLSVLVPIKTTKIAPKALKWDSEDELLRLVVEDGYGQIPGAADTPTIGYVQVTMSLQKLINEKKAIIKAGFLITLLVIGIGVIFSFCFIRLMIKPLRDMSHTAMKIANGNLSLRVNKQAQDEIGVFSDCFNLMVDSLEKTNNKIKQLNQTLELKVRKRTEEIAQVNKRLQNQNVKLMEHDRLKSEFLANMSHELRTPLNAIIGFSRLLLKGIDGPLTEIQLTDLNSIYSSGKHLLTLITDILDLSKIESGKLELQLEEIDVAKAAEGVISTCGALTANKKVSLNIQVDPTLPRIVVDKTRFRQILLNILSNAIKFTHEGDVNLYIKKLAKENKILITVSDTGIGIKEEDIPKVFDKFRQIDGSSTRRKGGTGLGMSITKEFVEIHGGRIWLESEFGVGTTFYVELPIADDRSKSPKLSPQKQEIQYLPLNKNNGRQVLVVEDDPHMIRLYRRHLSNEGYAVVPVADSRKAVASARKCHPYAIILDIMLPHKDGWEIIQELKADKQTKDIPVIISSVINNKKMGFALGATAYLVKPIKQEELLEALNNLNHKIKKIALIDDNPKDILLIKRMLGNKKYVYSETYDGKQGLKLIRNDHPDLIILDLMMPKLDGFEVLRDIRDDQNIKDIPVIIMSAREVENQRQQALKRKSNVVSFRQKGNYEEQELIDEVSKALHEVS